MVLLGRRGDNLPLRSSGVHVGALPASPQVLSGAWSEQLGRYLAGVADPHRAAALVGVLRLGVDAEVMVDERSDVFRPHRVLVDVGAVLRRAAQDLPVPVIPA